MLLRREKRLPTQCSCRWCACGLLMSVFTVAAFASLLGTEPLRAQPAADEARGKPVAEAGKSPDAARDAIKREIEKLQKAGNWRALAAKLKDKNPEVRRQAVTALREVLTGVKNKAELKRAIPFSSTSNWTSGTWLFRFASRLTPAVESACPTATRVSSVAPVGSSPPGMLNNFPGEKRTAPPGVSCGG